MTWINLTKLIHVKPFYNQHEKPTAAIILV